MRASFLNEMKYHKHGECENGNKITKENVKLIPDRYSPE